MLQELADLITKKLGQGATAAIKESELTIAVTPEQWWEASKTLQQDPDLRFVSFVDLCGVDYPDRAARFEVVLHLLAPYSNQRVRLKTALAEGQELASITPLFPGANWFEREAFDMYGITFTNHPDMRRILTDYGFEGHPLRKDFPLTGFVEVRYDDEQKKVVYEPVRLPQAFRNFDFLSPWEGTDYVLPGDEKAAR